MTYMSCIMFRKQIFLRLNIDKFGINDENDKETLDFEAWLEKKRSEERIKRLKEQEEELDRERRQCLEKIKRKTLSKLKYKEWLAQKEEEVDIKKLQKEQEYVESELRSMRKVFSQLIYEEWLERKANQLHDKNKCYNHKIKQREEQEKRRIQAQRKYQEWLHKKEKEITVQKVNKLFLEIRDKKAKQIRKKESELAYNSWLANSKLKLKQPPSRKTSETNRQAASVGYINPNPWKPNIEVN